MNMNISFERKFSGQKSVLLFRKLRNKKMRFFEIKLFSQFRKCLEFLSIFLPFDED